MRICFLSSKHPPDDKRVFFKEARSLARAGHDVVHLAPGFGDSRDQDGVRLEIYQSGGRLRDRLLSLFRLYRRAAGIDADAYHCNEVDSWVVGVLLKILRRKVVVFDVHEHYPSTFAYVHLPRCLAGVGATAIRLVFRVLVRFTDRLVYAKRTVAEDFPGAADRAIVVLNCATLDDDKLDDSPPYRPDARYITAIHVGLINRERGWPQLVEAMRLSKTPNLRLKIIGVCTDSSKDEFKRAFAADDLADRVEIHEWVPFEEMMALVYQSHIGLVLFQPGHQNHVYAMPHKMFDYMKARLPVILPEFAVEVAPIIEEEECGILVDPSSPRQIADALDRLAADAELRARFGENGRKAVFRRYNWEKEVEKLLDMYRELETRLRKP